MLDHAARSAIAGVGSGGGGMGVARQRMAADRSPRAQALAGLSAADVAALPAPEAALALAGQLVDQARASLKAIDKKAVRGGDASQIELLEDAVCEVVFNSSLLMDAAGGLIEAQVALRQMLGSRDEIPMIAGRIRDGLVGRTDPGLVELAAELADFGIDCHLNEDPVDSGQPHRHPSAEAAHHQLRPYGASTLGSTVVSVTSPLQ